MLKLCGLGSPLVNLIRAFTGEKFGILDKHTNCKTGNVLCFGDLHFTNKKSKAEIKKVIESVQQRWISYLLGGRPHNRLPACSARKMKLGPNRSFPT